MESRVGGLETELGLVCVRADGSRALEPEAAARELFRPVVAMGRSSNVFLRNASRLYLDVGSHPEYATAECDDWWELVAQDRAGERTFAQLARVANAELAARGEDARIHLLKNNVDSAGNSFGSHENYLVDRRGEFTRLPRILLPFLATRQIVTGAGGVVREEDDTARFVFSRRSDHMWEAVSSATTRTRPIINTRDEPHGDPQRFRRLHVIVGDSTMSELSTWLRFATTDLVLRLIETGRVTDLPELEDTIAAIRAVARDLTGRAAIPLVGGGAESAVGIQQRYLDLVAPLAREDEREVLETWQRTIDAVRTGDRSWAATRLDWALACRPPVRPQAPDVQASASIRLFDRALVQGDVPAVARAAPHPTVRQPRALPPPAAQLRSSAAHSLRASRRRRHSPRPTGWCRRLLPCRLA